MLDGGSRDVIEGVSLIQDMRRQAPQLAHTVAAFELGERLLKRQRYPFPHDWPQVRRPHINSAAEKGIEQRSRLWSKKRLASASDGRRLTLSM